MEELTSHYRSQAAIYTDAIRMSDFKANVAIIYGAFTIGPIIGNRSYFPHFVPIAAVLLPYIVAFFCLLLCLLPRYPRSGRSTFPISRTTGADDFLYPDGDVAKMHHQVDVCVVLCRILYRKTFLLRISFAIYIGGTIGVFIYLLDPWK